MKSVKFVGLMTVMSAVLASTALATGHGSEVVVFGLAFGLSAIIGALGLVLGFGAFKVNPLFGLVAGFAVLFALGAIVLTSLGFGALSTLLGMPIFAGLIVFGAAFVIGDFISALF